MNTYKLYVKYNTIENDLDSATNVIVQHDFQCPLSSTLSRTYKAVNQGIRKPWCAVSNIKICIYVRTSFNKESNKLKAE